MKILSRRSLVVALGVAAASLMTTNEAHAQWRRARRPRLVPTSAPVVPGVERSPMLGTFYPQPYIPIPPNYETGVPYRQAGPYEGETGTLYGPLSVFRATTTPVQYYQRGYDGSLITGPGVGISTPNLPGSAPVIYSLPYPDGPVFR